MHKYLKVIFWYPHTENCNVWKICRENKLLSQVVWKWWFSHLFRSSSLQIEYCKLRGRNVICYVSCLHFSVIIIRSFAGGLYDTCLFADLIEQRTVIDLMNEWMYTVWPYTWLEMRNMWLFLWLWQKGQCSRVEYDEQV